MKKEKCMGTEKKYFFLLPCYLLSFTTHRFLAQFCALPRAYCFLAAVRRMREKYGLLKV